MDTALKLIRKQKRITQEQAAQKSNIALRSYQYYETGERIPNAYTVQLIAYALGSTVEELFPLPERQPQQYKKFLTAIR